MPLRFNCFLSLLFGFLLVSGGAQAANVHIDDTAANGNITISWSGFLTFTVNGSADLGTTGSATYPPQFLDQPPGLSFFGSYVTNDVTGASNTLYFVDPGTTHIRDTLTASAGIEITTAFLTGNFHTDAIVDQGPAPPPPLPA